MRSILAAGCALACIVVAGCQPHAADVGGGTQVAVTDNGFEPALVRVPHGEPVTLVFTRKTDQTCATDVVFPALKRHYDLPLHRAVRVTLPANAGDTLRFECGMGMLTGAVVVN